VYPINQAQQEKRRSFVTTTMPSTSRTMKLTQKIIVVGWCSPHSISIQNNCRTIVDVGSGTSLEIRDSIVNRHVLFLAHWRIMTGWSILAQQVNRVNAHDCVRKPKRTFSQKATSYIFGLVEDLQFIVFQSRCKL
jgi:hypothetical protein